jgi:hemolysin activation/secretion protein
MPRTGGTFSRGAWRARYGGRGAVILVAGMFTALSTAAQTPPVALPSQVAPGRPPDRPAAASAPVPLADFDFQIQAPAGGGGAQDGFPIRIVDVRLEGGHPTILVEDLIAPLRGQTLPSGALSELAEKIEERHRAAGFVLTRVFLPPQTVADGRYTLRVLQGYVGRVGATGGSAFQREIVTGLAAPVTAERPVTIGRLERALLLAGDLPGLTASGLLRPGTEAGESELAISLVRRPWQGGFSLNNRGSRFAGPWTQALELAFNDQAGLGEQIGVTLSGTPNFRETRSLGLRWTQPTPWDGLNFGAEVAIGQGEPGQALRQFGTRTDSHRVAIKASYPILRSRADTWSVEGGIATSRASTRLLGQSFSRDDLRSLELKTMWLNSGFLDGVTLGVVGLTQGLDLWSATNKAAPLSTRTTAQPNFAKLNLGLRRVQTLFADLTLSVDAQAQIGFGPQFASEQFGLGGSRLGRGYEPSELTGDSGAGAATELRWFESFDDDWIKAIQPYAFFDAGRVWTRGAAAGRGGRSLTSAGAGVRAFFVHDVSVTMEVARGFVVGPVNGERPTKFYLEMAIPF